MSSEPFREKSAPESAEGGTRSGERRTAASGGLRVDERRSGADRRTGSSHAATLLGGVRAGDRRMGVSRWIVWLAAIVLAFAAWPVYKGSVYEAGTGFGYAIGIIGAVMMLLMLLYPLRKHVRWARNWGPLRYWFMLHMVFGIGGPTLVLFHTTFHVKSVNAAVSLFSMLLVAISGVIGRFIYTRIHQGLYGRQSNLEELQKAVSVGQEQVSSILMEAPAIGEKLKQFRDMASDRGGSFFPRIWKFMTLGWQRRKLGIYCHQELRRAVDFLAQSQGWDSMQRERHWQGVAAKVSDYLSAVQQATQYSAYERLFRWWHVLHTPFVWLLGISAVIHVVAVNMY